MKSLLFLTLLMVSLHNLVFVQSSGAQDCMEEKKCDHDDDGPFCGDDGKMYLSKCEMECHGKKQDSDANACSCKTCKKFNWKICDPETHANIPEGCDEVCKGNPWELCG